MAEQYGALAFAEELKGRTKQFALRTLKMFRSLPRTDEARIVGRQVLRSCTSVAANYRAVCRARSQKEFVAKLGVVIEELDETIFWFEILSEGQIVKARKLAGLLGEGNELLAIFAASRQTAKRKMRHKNESSGN